MNKDWKIIQLDENGDPVVMHLYDDKTGLMIEERVYRYKKLRNSRVYGEEETLLTIYHEHTDTPLVESRHHYTNNGKNQHNIHFDSNGNQYYSTRVEQLNEFHQRRYSNDILLVEIIQNIQPPSYTYFYPNGTVLINYISHGDGSGSWHLYDEAGNTLLTLAEPDEANPANFISSPIPRKWDPKQADWELAIIYFKDQLYEQETTAKLYNLDFSNELVAELKQVDWENLESTFNETEDLPYAINGMLCQDEAVVLKSYRRIVREIRHQGSIYECTYKVTGILARMLPLYANDQIVKKNLLPFLYEVLNYQGINENKASYDELIDSIKRSTALIEQLATDADAEVAQCAQFLLSQVTA